MVVFEVKNLFDCDIPSFSLMVVNILTTSFNTKISASCSQSVFAFRTILTVTNYFRVQHSRFTALKGRTLCSL